MGSVSNRDSMIANRRVQSILGVDNRSTDCQPLEIDDPLLPGTGRVDRLEVHWREARQSAERVHARGSVAREVVVEEYVREVDLVSDRTEVREPLLHLRRPVDLDPPELLQGAVPDEP